MMIIIKKFFIFILFKLAQTNSVDNGEFGKDRLDISKECDNLIGNDALDCMTSAMNERDKSENNSDMDNLNSKFVCCSTWDVADCYLNAVKVSLDNNY